MRTEAMRNYLMRSAGSRGRQQSSTTALLLLAAAIPTGFARAQHASPRGAQLHAVSQVRTLSIEQATRKLPVRLHGVVTVDWGWNNAFYFQDSTGGTAVLPIPGNPTISAGQEVEIVGVTEPGKFASAVDATSIRILGLGRLPAPPLMHAAQMFGGVWDSQRVAVRGIIRSARIEQQWGRDELSLNLDEGSSSPLTIRVVHFEDLDWHRLRGATVLIRGVVGTVFNANRQFGAVRVFASGSKDIDILHPGPADAFGLPLTDLQGLLTFGSLLQAGSPVRVRGRVTYSDPILGIYLQGDSGGVLVHPTEPVPAKIGQLVEAVGYPAASGYSPVMSDALLRDLPGDLALLTPLEIPAAQAIVSRDNFPYSPYDVRLLKVRGRLLEIVPGHTETVLVLKEGDTSFRAIVPGDSAHLALPAMYSVLDLTGICETITDNTRKPVYIRLRLRSINDIVRVKRAPWWTADHARWVVLALAVCLIIVAIIHFYSRRESHLRRLTLEDPLTGLYNRRGFGAFAEHQWQLALRQSREITLFYIDLNDFKKINDVYGHKHGDEALSAVADILRHAFRRTDVIGRIGGDEFAVLAVETGHACVAQLRDRLFDTIRQENGSNLRPFKIELSAGTVVCGQQLAHEGIEQLMDRADAEMYKDKRRRKEIIEVSVLQPAATEGQSQTLRPEPV